VTYIPDIASNETKLPFHTQVRHSKNYTLLGNPSITVLQIQIAKLQKLFKFDIKVQRLSVILFLSPSPTPKGTG